ncbi:hypothetical protein DXV76_09860 [Rhodobacteraceae bacterium CCMM004]|nr:hypothetical protein DXV76_09860 [Rhodobacteraceae bacterium CCMM004]
MKWTVVADNWPAFVGPIEQTWPELDEADLLTLDGDKTRFAAYLAKKHELTRNEAHEEIEIWLQGKVPADVAMDDQMDGTQIAASADHIPAGEDVYSEDGDFGDDRLAATPMGRRN